MIDETVKQNIRDIFVAAQERLAQPVTSNSYTSGPALEGVKLLGQAQQMIDRILDEDPYNYVILQKELDAIWVAFVRENDTSGLGCAAAMIGRNK